jgi:nickel transport protein
MRKTILAMFIVLLFARTASAHHFWIEKESDRFKVSWGHYPEVQPYEPERIKEARAFDMKGKAVTLERKNEKDKVYFLSKQEVSVMTISSEGGFLVITPEGRKKITKREAQKAGVQVIDSVYYSQYAKSLFGYSNAAKKPAGVKFEIVPLKNPFVLQHGESLPVRVYFDGKPADGVTVEINNSKETMKTDTGGIAHVKMSEKGLQSIIAKKRMPAKDNPDADYLSFTTALSFELK